jgi:hypothetical protein
LIRYQHDRINKKIVINSFNLIRFNVDIKLNRAIEIFRNIDFLEEMKKFKKKRRRLIVIIDDCNMILSVSNFVVIYKEFIKLPFYPNIDRVININSTLISKKDFLIEFR